MRFRFSFLVALSAALVAGCAAYYSVFGLSQLFAGASTAVIIMASSLEFSKVIAVSMLEKYWNRIGGILKIYLIIGIVVLVCVTSAGIYGFLSNAYQKTASNLELTEATLNTLNSKKGLFETSIVDNQKIIEYKKSRALQLSSLRDRQEGRIDAAGSNTNRNRARSDINTTSKEVQTLNTEIDVLNSKNTVLSDSVNFYANKIIEVKSKSNSTSEIGPLKYLAQLTGYPMDKVINWFILLLIFVFDPLAVALVIGTNKVLEFEKQDRKKKEEPFTDLIPSSTPIQEEPEVDLHDEVELEIPESIPESIPEPEVTEPVTEPELIFRPKKEPVVTTGKVELQDIKEIKEKTNRGFSVDIPKPSSNTIERIGSNKMIKDNNKGQVIFKRNR